MKIENYCLNTRTNILIIISHHFKHMFLVFKQHYTHFHTLFRPHIFPKKLKTVV